MRTISSRQNAIVRTCRALAAAPDPAGARVLLDGAHLVRDAQDAGTAFELVVVSEARLAAASEEGDLARALDADGIDVVVASDDVFAAVSPVKTPSGLVAIASRVPTSATAICSRNAPFILAAVDVQDPGNVGSLLRAAEAGGVTGMFVCGTSASPFSWKAVRGSMGSALRLPVVAGMQTASVISCMQQSGLRTVAAVPRHGEDPDAVDWRGGIGLLLGGEGAGLTDETIARCDVRVTIPMSPRVESLNVAAAGAVLVYAARRQRL